MVRVGGPCLHFGCRKTSIYNSDYCYKHHDESAEINTTKSESDSNQIIRFEVDGRKKTIDSKEIDDLLDILKKAKKFWIVDLTVDENEFVQYAIEKGELEHWDKLEMVESMEMTVEQSFSTLKTKITGEYSGNQLWWNDEPAESLQNISAYSEEESDEQEATSPFQTTLAIVVVFALFVIFFVVLPGHPPEVVLGNLVGEAICQGICGLGVLAGGAGASSLGRSESGKFTK